MREIEHELIIQDSCPKGSAPLCRSAMQRRHARKDGTNQKVYAGIVFDINFIEGV